MSAACLLYPRKRDGSCRQRWGHERALPPSVMVSTAQQPKSPRSQRFVFIRFFLAFGFAVAPWRAAASACLAHCASSSASS